MLKYNLLRRLEVTAMLNGESLIVCFCLVVEVALGGSVTNGVQSLVYTNFLQLLLPVLTGLHLGGNISGWIFFFFFPKALFGLSLEFVIHGNAKKRILLYS